MASLPTGSATSYLFCRSQLVRGGTLQLPLFHGDPQGSIIGTIIFLTFVNDLSCFLPHDRLLSYADDTQIIDSAPSNPSDLQMLKSLGAENVRTMQAWFSSNSLQMNTEKNLFHSPEYIKVSPKSIRICLKKSYDLLAFFVLRIYKLPFPGVL